MDQGHGTETPAGASVRFQVVHVDGRVGSSWSVRSSKHAGDVYVTHRDGGRWVHTSLHRDGRWHFAITPEGQDLVPKAPAYLAVTRDREEIAPGWLHAMRITVADSELRSQVLETSKVKSLVAVPMPEGYDGVSIDVLLGAPDAPALTLDQCFLIAQMRRGDSGLAVVVARPTTLDSPIADALAPALDQAIVELRQFGWDGHTPTRIVIVGTDAHGYLRQAEIAVDGPRADAEL